MGLKRSRSTAIAALLSAALIGGGVAAVAPAVAQDGAQYVATNWKKIWKKQLRPLADQRYYTKVQSDTKYSTKTETGAALGNYYTKAQSDAGYAPKATTYSKTESDANYYKKADTFTKTEADARYARSTALIRGSVLLAYNAAAASQQGSSDISFGATFSVAPIVHMIPVGGLVPVGCSGTASAPDAAPGHLCIFASFVSNSQASLGVCRPSTAACGGTADPWGVTVFTNSTAAGLVNYFATWAARPVGVVSTAAFTAAGPGVNEGAPNPQSTR